MKSYSAPAAPQAPILPADLASELSAFDASEPTKASADAAPVSGDVPNGAEAFLTFLEADEVEEHHH